MIPKTALCALGLLMTVSCAFGYCIRGIVDKALQERKKAKEQRWMHDFDADHDLWEDE